MSLWGKIVAGLFILMGTQGFGMALSQEMKCFLYHLDEQKRMLFYIMREISFLHKPMQEIFLSLPERLQKPYDNFIEDVARRMDDETGKSLQEIWDEEIENLEKNRCYPKKTFLYLRKIKRCFHCEEDQMQKESFAMLSEEIEEEINRIKKGKEEKDRLIRTLSLLAGILCIVIFI